MDRLTTPFYNRSMATRVLPCDPQSVRQQHGRMFRSLNRQLGIHKHALSAEVWRVLKRAAFSLYLDSLDRQLPLLGEDQLANDLVHTDLNATEMLTTPSAPHVRQRTA
jgi:hypothetical protein